MGCSLIITFLINLILCGKDFRKEKKKYIQEKKRSILETNSAY